MTTEEFIKLKIMEESKLLVIDASIIIKWLLEEENGMVQAEKIQNDFIERAIKIVIPGHCYSEVANTISRKAPDLALNFLSKLKVSMIREQMLNISKITLALELMTKYPKISFMMQLITHSQSVKAQLL